MKRMSIWLSVGLIVAAVAGLALVGCETTKSEANVITLTPATATLTNDYATVVFTASFSGTSNSLALPLQWSVSNPERGTITASGSMMAIYRATWRGEENVVTVRDQGDNEGTAIVVKE